MTDKQGQPIQKKFPRIHNVIECESFQVVSQITKKYLTNLRLVILNFVPKFHCPVLIACCVPMAYGVFLNIANVHVQFCCSKQPDPYCLRA